MFLIALTSLSAVPDLKSDCKILSATKTNCGGTTSLSGCTDIIKPLSSVKVEISMKASSSDASFKSAIVLALLAAEPPPASGWSDAIRDLPSPPRKDDENALFKTSAPLTSLVLAIDFANALTYLFPRES